MAYQLPDVFVSVSFPDIVPTIETPSLLPVMVGPHYNVVKNSFLTNLAVVSTSSATYSFPDLPNSYNETTETLKVDATAGFTPTAYLITPDGGEVDITSSLTFSANEITVPSGTGPGAIYVSYRYKSDRYSGVNLDLLTASSISDLVALFGANSLSPANPLGFAMYSALVHGGVDVAGCSVGEVPDSSGDGVYSGSTANEIVQYSYVADFLKAQDVHSIVLLTSNASIMNIFRSHVRDMSSELGRSERRLFFSPSLGGTDNTVRGGTTSSVWTRFIVAVGNPGTGPHTIAINALDPGEVYDFGGYPVMKNSDGIYINGATANLTFETEAFTVDPSEGLIELESSVFSPAATQVRSGDKIYMYIAVSGDTALPITDLGFEGMENFIGYTNSGGQPLLSGPYRISRTINPVTARNNWVAALKQFPRSYADERLVLVGPNYVYDPDTEQDVPSYYAAAKLAGEVSRVGVAPAGASPGMDPLGFEDSRTQKFYSSRYFTEEEMREIGGSGWTMLVNNTRGQQLTTQHTVTTNMTSPEYYELILGVERDFLARFYRNELRKILRRFRVDDATLADISITCGTIAHALYSTDSVSRCFRSVKVLGVVQNPLQRDQVLIDLEVTHLYPLNTIKIKMQVVA